MANKMGQSEEGEEVLKIFPLEVWERIFHHLKNEDLLACRLVCREFKNLVDDQFDGQIWKPYFAKNRIAHVLSLFLVKCKGNRFSSIEDVEEFLENTKNFDSNGNGKNPFLNRTVILHCRAVEQYSRMWTRFPEVVKRFGHYIRHCLFFVHNEVVPSITNIPIVFEMKNLRTLTMYCIDFDRRVIHANLEKWKYEAPPPSTVLQKFSVLNILGDRGYTILATLFSRYGHTIKRLNCWGHNYPSMKMNNNNYEDASREFACDIIKTLPNVEEFKVCDVSSTLLNSLSKANWPLKRISLKLKLNDDSVSVGILLDSLSRFSGTLEAIYFHVDEKQLQNNYNTVGVQFPHVKDLRVPFFFVSRGLMHSLIHVLRRFQNLKHLQLVDTEECSGSLEERRRERAADMRAVIRSMWRAFPSGVEVISVRFRVYCEEMRSNVSAVIKYTRNRVPYYY